MAVLMRPPCRRVVGGGPVRVRKTSSRLGCCSSIGGDRHAVARPAGGRPRPTRRGRRRPGGSRPRRGRRAARRPRRGRRARAARVGVPGSASAHDEHLGADGGLELGGRALGGDPAAVDDGDPLREAVGLLEVLRGQQDRGPVAAQLVDRVPQLLARARVQPGGGLVEQDHGRAADEARAEVEPAPHAARVRGDAAGRRRRPARSARAPRRRARAASAGQSRYSRPIISTFSRPVSSSSTAANWPARPIRRRTASGSATTSWPSTHALPARRGAAAWRARARAWSCRRRWARAARTPCPASTARSRPSSATTSPKRMAHVDGSDGGGHAATSARRIVMSP